MSTYFILGPANLSLNICCEVHFDLNNGPTVVQKYIKIIKSSLNLPSAYATLQPKQHNKTG